MARTKGAVNFHPTEEQRRMVAGMATYGIPHVKIARTLQITDETLEKHFRDKLDLAAAHANSGVAEYL